MKKARVFLSRRNLEILLSKLDRQARGEETACTIIKFKQPDDPPELAQELDEITITAVENSVYYRDRSAGSMLPEDEARCAPLFRAPVSDFPDFSELDLYDDRNRPKE